jgi:hypothetical protein
MASFTGCPLLAIMESGKRCQIGAIIVFLAVGIFFSTSGVIMFRISKDDFYSRYPNVRPDSVSKNATRELCYIATRATDDKLSNEKCTQPLSDQGWCSQRVCSSFYSYHWCFDEYIYPWPTFCFSSSLTVTLYNTTRVFTKDCGNSKECADSFNAPVVTYTAGQEKRFEIGSSRFKAKAEDITMIVFGGIVIFATFIWALWLISGHFLKRDAYIPQCLESTISMLEESDDGSKKCEPSG